MIEEGVTQNQIDTYTDAVQLCLRAFQECCHHRICLLLVLALALCHTRELRLNSVNLTESVGGCDGRPRMLQHVGFNEAAVRHTTVRGRAKDSSVVDS